MPLKVTVTAAERHEAYSHGPGYVTRLMVLLREKGIKFPEGKAGDVWPEEPFTLYNNTATGDLEVEQGE